MSEQIKSKEEWYDECVALQQEGELPQAIAELKKLLEVYPDYALGYLALAVFSQEKGDDQGTLEAMEKACALEQEDPFYFTAFSSLAIKCGNRELAEEALMKAQEARFELQLRKMNELRKEELKAREKESSESEDGAESADE
jgi:tetratricopeptide (TPR) repeat protein